MNTGILLFCFAFCEQAFAKHYPLFRVYIFRYITKKDIKFFAPLSFKKAVKTVSVLIAVLNRCDTVCFFEQAVKMLDILIAYRLGD